MSDEQTRDEPTMTEVDKQVQEYIKGREKAQEQEAAEFHFVERYSKITNPKLINSLAHHILAILEKVYPIEIQIAKNKSLDLMEIITSQVKKVLHSDRDFESRQKSYLHYLRNKMEPEQAFIEAIESITEFIDHMYSNLSGPYEVLFCQQNRILSLIIHNTLKEFREQGRR